MQIAKFAIERRVTITMAVLAILLLGVVSYSRLPVDLLPNMSFPMAAVIVDYPGAAPEEVEAIVTRPVEGVLGAVSGINQIQSTSSTGRAIIILQFDWKVNMDMAALDVREKLDMAKRFLPSGVGNPSFLKFDPSMLPLLQLGLASDQVDLLTLRELADVVAQRLERIPGVASVSISGGAEQEYRVDLNQKKLEQYGVSLSQVGNALRSASVNLPGGKLREGNDEYLVRTLGKVTNIDELKRIVVGIETKTQVVMPPSSQPAGGAGLPAGLDLSKLPGLASGTGVMPETKITTRPIYLADVAQVELTTKQQGSTSRLNGKPNVSLSLQKQSDANTVAVANLVHAELEQLRVEFPDVNLLPTMDQSEFINIAIDNVTNSAIVGALLAVLILLFFLRSVRTTLIIAISVPISVVATFVLMYFGNLTINMMTLAGLALGIGMLVDNSIVVLENIYRYLELGESRRAAAEKGAREVSMAITASTLTTVCVFLPVVFLGGITGILFKELALTVSFSLLSSLVVALTVVPMLSASILADSSAGKGVGRMATAYGRALGFSLRHKLLVAGLVVTLLIGSLFTFRAIGGEFMPAMDTNEFSLSITMPPGGSLADLQTVVDEVEAKLLADPDIELLSTSINSSMLGVSQDVSQRANLQASLRSQPVRRTAEIVADLRHIYADYAQAKIEVSDSTSSMGMGGGGGRAAGMNFLGGSTTVQVDISGPELTELADWADRLVAKMEAIDYLSESKSSLGRSQPELQVQVDFAKAGAKGIPAALIGSTVRAAFQGETVTQISQGGKELAVVVRLRPEDRQDVDDLKNLVLASAGGQVVRLGDVAEVVKAAGPRQINRVNNRRLVSVTASVANTTDLRTAERDLLAVVQDLSLPDAYQANLGGQLVEMDEAFSGLLLALGLAIALVYMVMAAQFESFLHPLTVMFTLPLAAIGVLFSLFIGGHKFNVPSMIGIILLSGIVVNNAIVLVDYINQLRRQGRSLQEAVVEAGQARLRPILMTALTTLLGLVPMAIRPGAGAEMLQPLAISVMGGLATGTLLTLFVIPCVYVALEQLIGKFSPERAN